MLKNSGIGLLQVHWHIVVPSAVHKQLMLIQVSTHNLERVRRIKSRMVRLTTRVETIREFLQKFLDDDSDMHDMNLTARQQDMLERQTSLIRNSLARSSLTGKSALLRCWLCRNAS